MKDVASSHVSNKELISISFFFCMLYSISSSTWICDFLVTCHWTGANHNKSKHGVGGEGHPGVVQCQHLGRLCAMERREFAGNSFSWRAHPYATGWPSGQRPASFGLLCRPRSWPCSTATVQALGGERWRCDCLSMASRPPQLSWAHENKQVFNYGFQTLQSFWRYELKINCCRCQCSFEKLWGG